MFESYDSIFNRRGEAYHQAMRMVPNARRNEFMLAIDNLNLEDGQVICDAPSGGGYVCEFLASNLNIKLKAVDPSQVFAKTWADERVEWHLAPLEQLPIEHGALDGFLSIAGLHHVENRPAAFREMRRVLRSGGRLCILEVPKGAITDKFLNGFVDQNNSMGHDGRFVDDDFRNDLRNADFSIEHDELCSYTWDFKDEQQMVAFVKLMFWLDKADHDVIGSALKDILGVVSDREGCRMNWQMQLITASYQCVSRICVRMIVGFRQMLMANLFGSLRMMRCLMLPPKRF